MVEGGDHTGSMPMFAIFLLSLYSLYLIPYTLYKLCGGSGESDEVRTGLALVFDSDRGHASIDAVGAAVRRVCDHSPALPPVGLCSRW